MPWPHCPSRVRPQEKTSPARSQQTCRPREIATQHRSPRESSTCTDGTVVRLTVCCSPHATLTCGIHDARRNGSSLVGEHRGGAIPHDLLDLLGLIRQFRVFLSGSAAFCRFLPLSVAPASASLGLYASLCVCVCVYA